MADENIAIIWLNCAIWKYAALANTIVIVAKDSDIDNCSCLCMLIVSEYHNTPLALLEWRIKTQTFVTEEMYYGLLFSRS